MIIYLFSSKFCFLGFASTMMISAPMSKQIEMKRYEWVVSLIEYEELFSYVFFYIYLEPTRHSNVVGNDDDLSERFKEIMSLSRFVVSVCD